MPRTPPTTAWFHGTRHSHDGRDPAPITEHATPVHISVVLDRSGSMSPIAGDIVGGFNQFLADQRSQPGSARITLAQFDGQDPFEVLIDAADLRRVTDLDRSAYQPRGMTPLYDAIGRTIGRIDSRIARRKKRNLQPEDQVVVIVTDGLENASREHTRSTIFESIDGRRKERWVFVFLGANQDSYASGEAMAVAPGNRADWVPSPEGSRKMWKDLAYSAGAHRSKPHHRRRAESEEFYQEHPDAE